MGNSMSSTLHQVTNVALCSNWQGICDRNDISIKKGCINQWKKIVANFMKENYLPEHWKRLKDNLLTSNTRFGLSLSELILRLVPSSSTTQKGDLAEAVCSLSYEKLFRLSVPYYKWANKNHIEMPERGIDVMAFHFDEDPSNDSVYLTEVKWRDDTSSLVNIITIQKGGVIVKFSNLSDLNVCDELNLLLKKIENDPNKNTLSLRIFDFLDRFRKTPKKIFNSTFFMVDTDVDLDKCVKALTPISSLPRELKSFNHLSENLEAVTSDIFRVINT